MTMYVIAAVLAGSGTALLAGSAIALRRDSLRALNYCDADDPGAPWADAPLADAPWADAPWWDEVGDDIAAWEDPAGAATAAAPPSYSDGRRLTRIPLPGTRLVAARVQARVEPAPRPAKLTGRDLRRIRRRIRRDTRTPHEARVARIRRMVGVLMLAGFVYKVGPGISSLLM